MPALLLSLAVSALLAGIMLGVYGLCRDALAQNRRFGITLMMLSLVSTVLLTLIRDNPGLSLGALGALSICRIRTNTKDPRDLGFVFWSLTIGISSALGAFAAGAMITAAMSAVLLTLGRMHRHSAGTTLVIRGQRDRLADVQAVLYRIPGSSVRSKSVSAGDFELVYSLDVPREEEERLLAVFSNMQGVRGVNVLAPETEVA